MNWRNSFMLIFKWFSDFCVAYYALSVNKNLSELPDHGIDRTGLPQNTWGSRVASRLGAPSPKLKYIHWDGNRALVDWHLRNLLRALDPHRFHALVWQLPVQAPGTARLQSARPAAVVGRNHHSAPGVAVGLSRLERRNHPRTRSPVRRHYHGN
jgi:hypothetical protein